MTDFLQSSRQPDRRRFLATAASLSITPNLFSSSASAEDVDPARRLKVGLIGAGGRGTGAAKQALSADANVELHAVADVFGEALDLSLATLGRDPSLKAKVNVPVERRFIGLDAYRRVLDSGVDVVLLATPPGFRPLHLRAAVEAGAHCFVEKPMAVDSAGVRHLMETLALARERPLSLVSGFCWRYAASLREAFRMVHEEDTIGRVTGVYSTYYSVPTKPHLPSSQRPAGMSDVEWHLRNWYNYSWLNGGGFVSQAVHSVDKALWAMGDVPPLSCRAVGGLAAPVEGGDTFDHYHCSYLFPNGIWCHLGARKMSGCLNENADYIQGTHGRLTIGRGTAPFITDLQGKMLWRYRPPHEGEPNKYQTQHDELFQSIRASQPVNDGEDMIRSTLMAILGRMAAHTGQEITWEQALNAGEHLLPQMADLKWTDTLPAFERPIPGSTRIPGI